MLQYKPLCLLLTTTKTSWWLCLLLEGCPKKIKTVVGKSGRGLFLFSSVQQKNPKIDADIAEN